MIEMILAAYLGLAAPTAAPVQTLTQFTVALVSFDRRDLRQSTLPAAIRRRGRALTFAVSAAGDIVFAATDQRGRILCDGTGFLDLATGEMIALEGCGF